MKTSSRLLAAATLLAITTGSALALTVPVAEDTCSSAADKSIKAASGSATSMMVNAKQTAFIRFDLNDLDVVPSPILPGNIKSAVLRLYVISAKPAADLSVHTITSAWSEHFATAAAPMPDIDLLPIANIHAAQLSAKNYVTVDITGAVVEAIQKGNVFGFAIKTASAKVVLASKEGSATGYPAQLDIDANLAENGNGTVSTKNLVLPATTVNAGIIYSGADTLVQAFGTDNFFAGVGAGNLAMAGTANTASGRLALVTNTTGSMNTASGMNALYSNSTGDNNTVSGCNALRSNTIGNENTADGYSTLYSITNGSYNIAIGSMAGYWLTTGSNNIYIGNAGFAVESNTIRLGTATHSATYIAGISGATASGGVAVYVNSNGKLGTITSSRRFKSNIKSMDGASDVLLALNPVTFLYKPEIDPAGLPQFGLIAEEVEQVCPDLVVYDDKGQIQTVRYEAVNAMLLNEFLKEHKRVGDLEEQVRALVESKEHKRVGDLEEQVRALVERMAAMEKKLP